MSVASEIQRIKTNIANAYDALENMGAEMPATENSDNLAATIATVSGGDIVTATNTTGSAIASDDKVWLEKVSGGWNAVNFFEIDTNTIDIRGTLNISNGLASGFNRDGFIRVGNYLSMSTASYWSFETEIAIGSDIQAEQAIFVEDSVSYNTILQVNSNGQIAANISSNHSAFNIGTITSTTAVLPDTPSKIKFEFTGSAYNIYLNDILEGSIASSVKLSDHAWNIGCANTSNPTFDLPYTSGYINLNKTKLILKNNIGLFIVWPFGKGIKEEFLTGIAKEAIANGATGEVKTVLPEPITVSVTADADDAEISAE